MAVLRVYNSNWNSSETTQCDKALLPVGKPVIFKCAGPAFKHNLRRRNWNQKCAKYYNLYSLLCIFHVG